MLIAHFGHSCLLVDTGAARLLFDPGVYSSGFEQVEGLDAILITHEHRDHVDLDKLPAVRAANPGARLFAPFALDGAEVVGPGAVLEVGGSVVTVLDAPHEVIHERVELPVNVGYLVDHGAFYHPGDSLTVPGQRVDVLGLPTAAPWLKVSEAADFLARVGPRKAVPIHEAVLAQTEIFYRVLVGTAPDGVEVVVLPRGEAVEL
ncbi:L-ascorbate metabolism protein UlaG (beta-lactamase superfamily) [Saccharothrix saharensis]|uniref:L-ascorbate metabolism protein UlaG (Beta-lactamase superfamily) n=1 Tax=Saccharothrix saharensis TaxID=571190 RepID=A0A543JH81_9PSEU|nr:MBL fold metallo-hydrolase [Saccharothrix saharensis]TQM82182.1 L-ascorbate metabolism protein UlaG (beta-lactamase superfamily) [Saccharothrix saharensis]